MGALPEGLYLHVFGKKAEVRLNKSWGGAL